MHAESALKNKTLPAALLDYSKIANHYTNMPAPYQAKTICTTFICNSYN